MRSKWLPGGAAALLLLLPACAGRGTAPVISDEALLDTVECRTLRYFTDFADPATGLARERSNDDG